jgi:hypothetical protein
MDVSSYRLIMIIMVHIFKVIIILTYFMNSLQKSFVDAFDLDINHDESLAHYSTLQYGHRHKRSLSFRIILTFLSHLPA